MSICESPEQVQYIDIDECIGSSLIKITTNFNKIESEICSDIQNIQNLQTDFDEFATKVDLLSSKKDSFVKASVVFNGDSNNLSAGERFIDSTFNVNMVSSLNIGTYAIYFSQPFSNNNYALVGQSNLPFLTTTAVTSQSAVINIRNINKNLEDANYVSVLVYSN
jgi:hypothetical protein